ncbi:PDZ domain-containing protein [Methylacidimicrobium sp. B4]|uniref:PDZ domain-containing protein n=1 Tax=Methylacidimicrobium sp. B4 TaxID=2796139 RepID=UPI001A8FAE56|nr:PDZ domain-containing protein [Methylacidimicrobium sp. B4]QSR84844.1 PDZ domain-containing protein [Methylacidimicrobium sp. B4]
MGLRGEGERPSAAPDPPGSADPPHRSGWAWAGWRVVIAALLSVVCALPLYGQEAKPLATTPPIAEAFPLVQQGTEVHAGCPLALNEYVILSPREVLRCFYVKAQRPAASAEKGESSEGGAPSGRHHGGGMGGMGGMGGGGMGMGGGGMRGRHGGMSGGGGGTEGRGGQEANRKALWTSVDAFREALAGLDGSDVRLVFAPPPAAPSAQTAKPDGAEHPKTDSAHGRVRDEPLVLPLGLLLGELEAGPTVLAVEARSAGAEAGLRSGDRIVSLDGRSCAKRLSALLDLYREAKSRGGSSVSVEAERGEARLTLVVPLPPRLGGSILDAP